MLVERSYTCFARHIVELEAQGRLPLVNRITVGVIADHLTHIQAGPTVVNKVIAVVPMHLSHNITCSMMLRKMNKPIITVPFVTADKERRVVFRPIARDQCAVQGTLDEEAPVFLGILDFLYGATLQHIGDTHAIATTA